MILHTLVIKISNVICTENIDLFKSTLRKTFDKDYELPLAVICNANIVLISIEFPQSSFPHMI